MLITVDIGNTRIKMGLFDGRRLVKHETFDTQSVEKALYVYSDWTNSSTRSIGIASGAIDANWPKSIKWLTIDSPISTKACCRHTYHTQVSRVCADTEAQ